MAQFDAVPECLRELRQWVCWRYEQRGDSETVKPTKVPVTIGGYGASSTEPSDWYSFSEVCEVAHCFDGIGFVFTADDPYLGIDLDDCLLPGGEIEQWAMPIIEQVDGTYTEVSPSGKGLKIICRAANPLPTGRKVPIETGAIELYDRGRFFTITGSVWDEAQPTEKQHAVDWIVGEYFPIRETKPVQSGPVPQTDATERARQYLATMEPAVAGQGGHDACFRAACKLVLGFDLDTDTAYALLANGYNQRCVPPWSEKELRHKVDSAHEQAGERGYLLTKPVHTQLDPGVDLSGIIGNTKPPTTNPPQMIPENCLRPPGIIADIIEHTLATSLYPQPELALAAAISLMATITGRRLTDEYGTRTNVYILGLAPSGSGKEQARRINKELLFQAGGEKMIGPERIGSAAGLVSSVAESPAILFQIDEIGRLLATLKNPGKAAHLYNIATVLMQLYGTSDSIWIGDAYADTSRTKKVNQPHAVIYGTSVPESFWASLSAENVTDGLLGRLMAFESSTGYTDPQKPRDIEFPERLVTDVARWIAFQPGGNLTAENPAPMRVGYSPAARDRFAKHMAEISRRRKEDDPTVAAIWSRAAGKAGKLALIFAASRARNIEPFYIELEDVDRGIAISNHLTRRTLSQVADHVSDNEQESRSKRVLRMLEKPMSRTQLCKCTQWLKSRERQEILEGLLEAGLIGFEEEQTNGRPVVRYFRSGTP